MTDTPQAGPRVLDSIGVAVIVTNLEGVVTGWNRAAEQLYGWSEQEALGALITSLLPPATRTEDTDKLIAAFASGLSHEGEWLVRGKASAVISARVTVTPLRSDHGTLTGAVGASVANATEVAARRADEGSVRRFRALVTHAADGIAVVDRGGRVTYASPSLCDVFGCTESDLLGTPGLDRIEPIDALRMRAQVADAIIGSVVGPIELRLRAFDGSFIAFEGYRSDLSADPDVAGIVWNLRDVTETRDAQRSLERSEERLQALAAGSSDVTEVVDAEGTIVYVGPSVERVFGYRVAELIGTPGADLVHPDDLAATDSVSTSILEAGELDRPERFRMRHRDGTWRWVEVLFTDLFDNPAIAGLVANIRDVTEQHLADQALRESEVGYRAIVETAAEGIWMHDLDGLTTFANPKMASLLATTVSDLEQRSLFDFIDPAERASARSKIDHSRRGESAQYEFTFRRDDGVDLDVLVSTSPQRNIDGTVIGVLKMMTDIGDRKRAEAENVRAALEDSLTGLASRALVIDRVTQTLERQQRIPGLAAVLFLDIDNFKLINDSLGHGVGDELLCEVARRIQAEARPQDTVGRFSGDEFVVVLDGLEDASDALAVADRISVALRRPMTIDGTELSSRASIGVALTPADDAGSLVRDADTAMCQAKERGGDRYELFNLSLRARAVARHALEVDLRSAIEQRQMCVNYQPVVAVDGSIVGFEALVRWNHPTLGQIPPGEFIPLAESTGLIVQLGAWTLDEACRDLAAWRLLPGQAELTVAVNLSGRQLAEPDIEQVVAASLAVHGLGPGALCLEITESVLMDDDVAATAALTAIHDLGVHLAVDDFGTGYSSLLYLRRFPVDGLKLDRFFVAGIDRNAQDPAIVRAVIDLAHSLGLYAVAEGVETAGQLEALQAMGCDYIQGFLFSQAVPPDEVAALLAKGPLVAGSGTTAVGQPEMSYSTADLMDEDPPGTSRTTVLIVDESDDERGMLFTHLEASGQFRVVGEAADAAMAVALAARTKPDVVLLEVVMPGMDGLQTLPLLLEASPTSRVAIFSGYVSRGLRSRAMKGGAIAVFEKSASLWAIIAELRALVPLPEAYDGLEDHPTLASKA